MPKLGLTMEEGTIVAWLVADGTEVSQGTPVLTIETDKVSSDVEASSSGILHILGEEDETFACGERIGWFLQPGEAVPGEPTPGGPPPATPPPVPPQLRPTGDAPAPPVVAAPGAAPSTAPAGRLAASPNARRVAAQQGVDLHAVTGSGPGGRIVSEDVLAAGANAPAPVSSPVDAHDVTVAARQSAERLGVDPAGVRPSGPGTRVDRADVERHVREQLAQPGAAPATTSAAQAPTATPNMPAEAPLLQTPTSSIPMTGMRGTIASRMHGSLQAMAQLTLTMDVTMDAVVAHRSSLEPGARPGYTDYVVAAAARALSRHPLVNSQISGGRLALLAEVNVGLAVALPGGLVVPVVRRADTLSIGELAAETTRLAEAAREGQLALGDMEGGTFSVTALGMYGVDAFTPVINPPNTAILGVGRLRDGTRWLDGVPARTTELTLSLTWDHRAFDGVPAAEFTAEVRDLLQGWEER